jgi:hypothetical protein
MLRDAILERAAALRVPPSVPAAVSAGDDVAGAVESGASVVGGLQLALGDVADFSDVIYSEGWADPAATYDGSGSFPGPLGFAGVRAAAGLATTTGYRRKRPREIAATSDAADTEGNAAADGHRARLLASPYGIWVRASGAWVASSLPDGPPDVLDTDAAAPFACSVSGNTYGAIAEGDYIGPWLFAEMRDMCNAMVWTQQTTGDLENGATGKDVSATDPTWAGAKAAVETLVAASPGTTALSSTGGFSRSIAYGAESGGTYTARLIRAGSSVAPHNDPAGVARTVEWYLRASAPSIGATTTAFDDNGDGVVDAAFKLYNTLAASTAVNPTYAFPANLATVPTWPTVPGAGTSKSSGWYVAASLSYALLMKWDVAGGFAYTSTT